MVHETFHTPKENLYDNHLKIINQISFTFREIDIITCLLHNRGEKKIAALLSISPRTVGAHTHNIMRKCGINSRDGIIDFIEKSASFQHCKQYYIYLVMQSKFEAIMQTLPRKCGDLPEEILIYYNSLTTSERKLMKMIEHFLSLSKIPIRYSPRRLKDAIDINLLANQLCGHSPQEYFLAIFRVLKSFITCPVFDDVMKDFQEDSANTTQALAPDIPTNTCQDTPRVDIGRLIYQRIMSKKIYQYYIAIAIPVLAIICMMLGGYYFKSSNSLSFVARSELPIPHSNVLLKRKTLISKIDEVFYNSTESIKAVVLVGVGGSGKTILARNYAKNQRDAIVWEFNAETPEILLASFEEFAESLSLTDSDLRTLEHIQQIHGFYDKAKRLRHFITKHIKRHPNWLLIYNNVESFTSIQNLFPYDDTVWGNGRVIITTRDGNFDDNRYIAERNIIRVGELNEEEKHRLFTKILGSDRMSLSDKKLSAIIATLPSFPLDISTAAYYIKSNMVSLDKYVEALQLSAANLEPISSLHEDMYKATTQYKQSRYEIITTSIKSLIAENPAFQNLLILVSTVDAANIPIALLEGYDNERTVEKFLHELNKFSFIVERSSQPQEWMARSFSVHRITQQIARDYLMRSLQSDERKAQQFQEMLVMINDYLSAELKKSDIKRLKLLLPHIERFALYSNFLSDSDTVELKDKLGVAYYTTALYEKALPLLIDAHKIYTRKYGEGNINTATVATHMASVYRNIGDYPGAYRTLKSAIKVYKDYYGEDNVEYARLLVYSGSVARNMGDYDAAEDFIKRGIKIYTEHYPPEHPKIFWSRGYLGNLYNNIGHYQKAAEYLQETEKGYINLFGLEHSKTAWVKVRLGNVYRNLGRLPESLELITDAIQIYTKFYGENSIEVAWALTHLGIVNNLLSNYSNSIYLLKKSLRLYSQYLPDNHIIVAWSRNHLAEAYDQLGDHKQALDLFYSSLNTYLQYYGPDHLKTAGILKNIALAKLSDGSVTIQEAEGLLENAIKPFLRYQHPRVCECLITLSDIKVKHAYENPNQSAHYLQEAVNNLSNALQIAKVEFPLRSSIVMRLQQKLEDLNFYKHASVIIPNRVMESCRNIFNSTIPPPLMELAMEFSISKAT